MLGVAKIATEKVIPGMQQCQHAWITAIASRTRDTAEHAAQALKIPRALASYDALINDTEIDAIYIPLPNHLHLEWAIKAARAGKHAAVCSTQLAPYQRVTFFGAAARLEIEIPFNLPPDRRGRFRIRRWQDTRRIGR